MNIINAQLHNQLAVLQAHTTLITPYEDFVKKLQSDKKLIIKFGMDPTSPDLHLGHAVVLRIMKFFQDWGHTVVVIIGDFTAAIGDPTGKSKTRPVLSSHEIQANTATYFEQVGRILDTTKITVRYNSEWLAQLDAAEIISLCSKVTVAQVLERQDFAQRIAQHVPISFHELLYPLAQGYDSVVLHADIEVGGTDQTFNLMMARHLQHHYAQEQQIVITVPLLLGLSGPDKMSKSLNNYVGLTEKPQEVYGKLMSISDERMWHYYQVLLGYTDYAIKHLKDDVVNAQAHPMQLKKAMAHAVITLFWDAKSADAAQNNFQAMFEHKDYTDAQSLYIQQKNQDGITLLELLKLADPSCSATHLRRLIDDGAVKIDNQLKKEYHQMIKINDGMKLKIGKHRFYTLNNKK